MAAEMVTKMLAGYASITSLKAVMSLNGTQFATFQETVSGGKPVEIQMLISDPASGGQTELLEADGQLYLGGAAATQYGKKYVLLDPNSANPGIKQLYSTYSAALAGSKVTQFVEFLAIAKDGKDLGSEDVNGVSADKYSLVLDLTKLPTADVSESAKTSLGTAAALGVTEIPCTFWLDGDGRMVKVEQVVGVSGQSATSQVLFTDYNAALDLVAPDPADVATV